MLNSQEMANAVELYMSGLNTMYRTMTKVYEEPCSIIVSYADTVEHVAAITVSMLEESGKDSLQVLGMGTIKTETGEILAAIAVPISCLSRLANSTRDSGDENAPTQSLDRICDHAMETVNRGAVPAVTISDDGFTMLLIVPKSGGPDSD